MSFTASMPLDRRPIDIRENLARRALARLGERLVAGHCHAGHIVPEVATIVSMSIAMMGSSSMMSTSASV